MSALNDLITIGKYADSPVIKNHTGNIISEAYYETTANKKTMTVRFPDPIDTEHDESPWYFAIPPVIIPANLTPNELLGLSWHLKQKVETTTQPVAMDVWEKTNAIVPFEHDDDRAYLLTGLSVTCFYHVETGLLFYDGSGIMNQSVGDLETNLGISLNGDKVNLFEIMYEMLIGTYKEETEGE